MKTKPFCFPDTIESGCHWDAPRLRTIKVLPDSRRAKRRVKLQQICTQSIPKSLASFLRTAS